MARFATPTIALLGGEGIGPEVVEATASVLRELLPQATLVRPLHGEAAVVACGSSMPAETQETCRRADGILFGATWKHSSEVLRFLRWGLDTYANLRPSRSRVGLPSPLRSQVPIDLVIVRENVEGEYPAREGELAEMSRRWPEFRDALGRALPTQGRFAVRVVTETGARRIAEQAARVARRRRERGRPGLVTIVTKANVLKRSDGLFREIAEQVLDAADLPHDHYYVDDGCRRLIACPEAFDVILAPNLYGDILSDVAAELVGGLGMAPSACVGDGASYFESVHGAAPDIAGKGIANPLATVLSAALMLEHLGFTQEALALESAVDLLIADGKVLTPDLGGVAKTADVIDALLARLNDRGSITDAVGTAVRPRLEQGGKGEERGEANARR
jgi:isocitrate/isopropylmalate dehydrogenase